jgi:hypothetical protein
MIPSGSARDFKKKKLTFMTYIVNIQTHTHTELGDKHLTLCSHFKCAESAQETMKERKARRAAQVSTLGYFTTFYFLLSFREVICQPSSFHSSTF